MSKNASVMVKARCRRDQHYLSAQWSWSHMAMFSRLMGFDDRTASEIAHQASLRLDESLAIHPDWQEPPRV